MQIADHDDVELDIAPDVDHGSNEQIDLAAEAFARLEGELALLRRAVQALAIEKANFVIPDYGSTLTELAKRLGSVDARLDEISDHPALQLTPDSVGKRIEAAAESARRSDVERVSHASTELHVAASELRMVTAKARTVEQQSSRLRQAVIGGVIFGMLLWSFLPGTIARTMPESWHWPERMAARMVGESTRWDAGARLMQSDSPDAWNALVQAATMQRNNSEAIAACRKSAATSQQAVSCTVRIGVTRN